jgi:acetyl esterase/lipase
MLDRFADDGEILEWVAELREWADEALPATLSETIRYGASAEQELDIWLPVEGEPAALAVSIHGGGWSAEFTRELDEPLSRKLATLGFAVANIEYRRVGSGGGLETTTTDVRSAIEAASAVDGLESLETMVVGHSAGGYLAAWAATVPGVTFAVPIAPRWALAPLDEAEPDPDNLIAWLGGTRAEVPDVYERADLSRLLPTGTPMHVLHGDHDTSTSYEESMRFCDLARRAGDAVELTILEREGHFGWLDPREPASVAVQRALTERLAASRSPV